MPVRGIRGATTVDDDTPAGITAATRELLEELIARNGIDAGEIASVFFTTTPDLVSEFPAYAARELGWLSVPLLCGHEMAVPGALPRCIRVLIHLNTDKAQSAIEHAYLRGAVALRRDLAERYGEWGNNASPG